MTQESITFSIIKIISECADGNDSSAPPTCVAGRWLMSGRRISRLCESILIEPLRISCTQPIAPNDSKICQEKTGLICGRLGCLFVICRKIRRKIYRFRYKNKGFRAQRPTTIRCRPLKCACLNYINKGFGDFSRGASAMGGVPVPCTTQYYFWEFNTVKRRGDLGYDRIG